MPELPEDSESNTSPSRGPGLFVTQAYIKRLRELELELEKTRSEASAARLDARAAELEMRIERLGGRFDNTKETPPPVLVTDSEGESSEGESTDSEGGSTDSAGESTDSEGGSTDSAGGSTGHARPELRIDHPAEELVSSGAAATRDDHASSSFYPPTLPRNRPLRSAQVFRRLLATTGDGIIRIDAAEASDNRPNLSENAGSESLRLADADSASDGSMRPISSWSEFRRMIGNPSVHPPSLSDDDACQQQQAGLPLPTPSGGTPRRDAGTSAGRKERQWDDRRRSDSASLRLDLPHKGDAKISSESSDRTKADGAVSRRRAPRTDSHATNRKGDSSGRDLSQAIELTTDDAEESQGGRKPAAWLLSALVHGLILLALAFFTLSSTPPGDQIAIAGSIAETEELALESLEIEASEMQPTPSEPTPSETEYEISEIGEIAISDFITDAPPAPPSPMFDSMINSNAMTAASMSLKSDSDAKIKFCGVEGGGNHFVYLVDSSGSMGDAFDSARAELLQSIDVLTSNQRFYIIFFDAESDYMRLSSPNQNEPRSTYATPENKLAVKRWAMTIGMDRGRAPYDALPFALDLGPDVIFLLSDGEFPQKIEDLLKELNRVENLFGDEGPISIVHTIGYHSREGESRMRRIAKQNGGQYRHVPKP